MLEEDGLRVGEGDEAELEGRLLEEGILELLGTRRKRITPDGLWLEPDDVCLPLHLFPLIHFWMIFCSVSSGLGFIRTVPCLARFHKVLLSFTFLGNTKKTDHTRRSLAGARCRLSAFPSLFYCNSFWILSDGDRVKLNLLLKYNTFIKRYWVQRQTSALEEDQRKIMEPCRTSQGKGEF